jgi:hypothetical protein
MLTRSLAPWIVVVSFLGLACGSTAADDSAQSQGDDLLKQTGPTSDWSYRGLLPKLDSPQMTVSLAGNTLHVTGLLPKDAGRLPFYAISEDEGDRVRVHLAYPIATVDPNGVLPDGERTRNPEPFEYSVCGGDNFHETNEFGAFGGFPFIEYVCNHRDSDGRVRGGIALHGPITSRWADGTAYWSLMRGPVSHACNRMLGEHVLEVAHVIGFDVGLRGTVPVKVIADFDRLGDKIIDVDYPATGWRRPDPNESIVFPIWQAVKIRPNGTTALDFPMWACEVSRCALMPPNARDPYTGEDL